MIIGGGTVSFLDEVGKILARIVQERLQQIAEQILPETLRKGRGIIFVVRQLVEKTREHNKSLFVLFVNLRKAYDSVPREALWKVLIKCGVPPLMLKVIRSFHDGICAKIRVGVSSTESFEVRNGLRQGCTLAPTLFNIYFSGMVANWRCGCTEACVIQTWEEVG